MGIASMIIGILAAILGLIPLLNYLAAPPAILGLALGVVDVVRRGKRQQPRRAAIAGTILNGAAIGLILVWTLVIAGGTKPGRQEPQGERVASPARLQPAESPASHAPAQPSPESPAVVPGSGGPLRFSCNSPSGRECTDYTERSLAGRPLMGNPPQVAEMLRDTCTNAMHARWGDGACPTANLLGTCTSPEGDLIRFYRPATNAARAARSCSGSYFGTWSAAP